MNDCLFCKIIAGDIPSSKVYEDECCYAFRDINPQARVHIVVVPKTHVQSMDVLVGLKDAEVVGLMRAVSKIARQEGLADTGYRVISNCGADACQSVPHLHIHILGGEKMSEKMA